MPSYNSSILKLVGWIGIELRASGFSASETAFRHDSSGGAVNGYIERISDRMLRGRLA